MHRKALLSAIIVVTPAVGVGAGIADNSQVNQRLQNVDLAVSQGTVVYKRKNRGRYYRETLIYTEDQRFVGKTLAYSNESLKGRLINAPVIHIFDGQDDYVVVDDRNPKRSSYVEIKAGKPVDVGEQFRVAGGLYPGASFILGRGLSSLSETKIVRGKSTNVIVAGKAFDGTVIKALLDAKFDYVARHISREKDGHVVQRVSLGTPVRFNNGPWVASTATCQTASGDRFVVTDEYSLINANFTRPGSKVFDIPVRKGFLVIDHRLVKPVVWKMAVEKIPKNLLEHTRQKVEEMTKASVQAQNAARLQRYIHIVLLFYGFNAPPLAAQHGSARSQNIGLVLK